MAVDNAHIGMPFALLKERIHETYMLDIGEDENHIEVKESYWCYFNLENGTLSSTKTKDFLTTVSQDVKLKDYRIFDDKTIRWDTIVGE